jgi:hypothetical protein
MASVIGGNDVDGLVPPQPTVLYIPSFLDALVQRYIAEGLDNSWVDHQDTHSTSWKANRFLESLQQTIRGFLFSVWFDSQKACLTHVCVLTLSALVMLSFLMFSSINSTVRVSPTFLLFSMMTRERSLKEPNP